MTIWSLKSRRAATLMGALVAAVSVACSPEVTPIHGGGIGGSGGGSVLVGGTSHATGAGTTGSSTLGPDATVWKGYVENLQFDDGTDTLELIFDDASMSSGRVRMGDRPPYPAPSDPSVGYPPGFAPGTQAQWLSGFDFTMVDASVAGPHHQLGISSEELWSAWCQIQTPVMDPKNAATYGCLPNLGYTESDSTNTCSLNADGGTPPIPVDCGKLTLCLVHDVCSCSASGCGALTMFHSDISFDITIGGSHADGSMTGVGNQGNVYNIHLDRQ